MVYNIQFHSVQIIYLKLLKNHIVSKGKYLFLFDKIRQT